MSVALTTPCTDGLPAHASLADTGAPDPSSEQAFDDIALLAAVVCSTPAAAIVLCDDGRQWSKAQWGIDYLQSPRAQALCDATIANPGQLLVVPDIAHAARFAATAVRIGQAPLRFYAGVALLDPDGGALGVVCVMDARPRQIGSAQRAGLSALARQAQHLYELRRQALQQQHMLSQYHASEQGHQQARAELEQRHQTLQRTASHDELTGLLNRAALARLRDDPRAMEKLERAPYCLGLLDVDHFKQVNDRHGHLLGDRALRAVADAVRASVRESDIAVRYGGEEFLIVLPGTALTGAYEVMHRIRDRVAASSLPFVLTVSAGIAAGDPSRERPEQVFERADQALYQAKAMGRDRVVADDTPR